MTWLRGHTSELDSHHGALQQACREANATAPLASRRAACAAAAGLWALKLCSDRGSAAASCLEGRASVVHAEDPSLLAQAYGLPPLGLARAVRSEPVQARPRHHPCASR